MKSEGDTVKILNKDYVLGKKIGGGLEGSVFRLADVESNGPNASKLVIKIINTSRMSDFRKNEVKQSIRRKMEIRSIKPELKKWLALPQYILEGDDVGYGMLNASNYSSLNKYLSFPDDEDADEWFLKKHTLVRRYEIIRSIFHALRTIHINGLIFTDLSPNNILVDDISEENYLSPRKIVFIDTDNMRCLDESYLGVLGTPGYMAPEIYKIGDESEGPEKLCKISVNSDIFSAAVIAFELLTLRHPFKGDHIDEEPPEEEEKAERIETDYIFKKGTTNTCESMLTPFFEFMTTQRIRDLFTRTFVAGKNNPELRPTDIEFFEAFDEGYNLLVECPNCGHARVLETQCQNQCYNCNEPIPEQLIFTIYSKFVGMEVWKGLNTILHNPDTDLTEFNFIDEMGNPKDKEYEISKIILKRGKTKNLLGRNFCSQASLDATRLFCITCSEDNDLVAMCRLKDSFPDTFIINKNKRRTEHPLPINKELEFDIDHVIVFERMKRNEGLFVTYGVFSRCRYETDLQ